MRLHPDISLVLAIVGICTFLCFNEPILVRFLHY
jgi:hypothetical protein